MKCDILFKNYNSYIMKPLKVNKKCTNTKLKKFHLKILIFEDF